VNWWWESWLQFGTYLKEPVLYHLMECQPHQFQTQPCWACQVPRYIKGFGKGCLLHIYVKFELWFHICWKVKGAVWLMWGKDPHITTIPVEMGLTIEFLSNILKFHFQKWNNTLNSIILAKFTSNNEHAHHLVVEAIPKVSQGVFGGACIGRDGHIQTNKIITKLNL